MTICYGNSVVRSFCLIVALFATVVFAGSLRADTYQLTSGETVNGEVLPTSANDAGVSVKVGEGEYKKVPWDSFSQEDLRKFRDNPKLANYAIPLLGVLAPIIFLAMPTKVQSIEQTWETQPATRPAAPEAVNPMQGETAPQQHLAGLRLADTAPSSTVAQAGLSTDAKPTLPATQTFARGQFTFNRRFIETKFAGFFGVVRHGADKDMVLVVKAARGVFNCNRISRIAANDFHVEVHHGHASEEIMIPFQEIKEIQLKHKDAP